MATKSTKKRKSPYRRTKPASTPAVQDTELPEVAVMDREPEELETALAALDAAATTDDEGDEPNAPLPSPDDSPAGDDSADEAPETALSNSAETPRDRSAAASAASPAASRKETKGAKPAAPKPVSLTGKQFAQLSKDQLRTLLADRENQLARVQEQLERAAPIAAAATDEALSAACGATCDAIAGLASMYLGENVRLTAEERDRLGALWAPALRPYLGTMAAHMPIVAALSETATIALGKYFAIQARRGQGPQALGVAA